MSLIRKFFGMTAALVLTASCLPMEALAENLQTQTAKTVSQTETAVANVLPTSYDMRDDGFVTLVKNQGTSENCWANAAVAAIEQNVVKHGYENSSVDFSEAALTWFSVNAGAGNYEGVSGLDAYKAGGNWSMPINALASWRGLEYDESEPTFSDESNANMISDCQSNICEYHLNSAAYFGYDETKLKNAIMTTGAATIEYYNDVDYFSKGTDSYYYPKKVDKKFVNHAVTVIGWDDNYSKNNFKSGSQPTKDGAWLVKGSWGGSFSDDGCFYMSYDESEIAGVCSMDFDKNSSLDNVYTYTTSGQIKSLKFEDTAYFANVFTSVGKETLKKAGFFVLDSDDKQTDYTVSIYKSLKSGTPVGTLAAKVSGSVNSDGFFTVDIPNGVSLGAGEKYSVVVQLSCKNGYGLTVFEGNQEIAKSSKGESYLSLDGKAWEDESTAGNNNAYIYAYTTGGASTESDLRTLTAKLDKTAGMEYAVNNAKKILANESSSKCDYKNAYLLLKAADAEKKNVTVISDADDFDKFANSVTNGTDYANKIVVLENDIDFTGRAFNAVGTKDNTFNGYFYGNGHVLSGITAKFSDTYGGVFGVVNNDGQVRNLSVRNADFSGSAIIGGITGAGSGTSITNCTFSGKISGDNYSGGIMGMYYDGAVSGCYSSVEKGGEKLSDLIGALRENASVKNTLANFTTGINGEDTTVAVKISDKAAYSLNTIDGMQKDSGQWATKDNEPKICSADEIPSHLITFTYGDEKSESITDYLGKTTFPNVIASEGKKIIWTDGNRCVNSDMTFSSDADVSSSQIDSDATIINYDTQGGTNNDANPAYVKNGETAMLSVPTKTGYTFLGWYADSDYSGDAVSEITGDGKDYTLYAKWEAQKFTVTFVDIDGKVIDTQTVEYGKSAILPEAPEIEGKVFAMWDTDVSEIYGDVTVMPVYNLKKYKITYNMNGGKNNINNPATVEYGNSVSLSKPTKTGYTFVGWYTNSKFSGSAVTKFSNVKADVKVYAKWKINTYTVVFTDLNGKVLSTQKVNYNCAAKSPTAPVIKNKKHVGWTKSISKITANITVKPVYYYYLSKCAFSGISNKVYTGSALTQSGLKVMLGKTTLKNGTNYTVSYKANISAGTAKVIIKGRTGYYGTVTKTFKISKRTASYVKGQKVGAYYYTSAKINASPVFKCLGKTLVNKKDYTISYSNNLKVGKAKAVVTFKGNYTGKKYFSYSIVKRPISKLTLSCPTTAVINGSSCKPTVTVKCGKITLKNGRDYTLTYKNNTNVGKGSVTVKMKNGFSGSKTFSFVIYPPKIKINYATRVNLGKVALSWNVAKTQGYIISYSKTSSTAGFKSITMANKQLGVLVMNGLTTGTKYYFKVCGYVKIGAKTYYGKWSDVKNVIA